ncbi:MAG: phosphoenolpyruvate carboxykinase (ATP) [Nitrososphaerota archaeon]|jgi:phosphoenolpyruvate carboxykinase (ATP)|nr:phosphoenolpyruvate carboxykinase (ATP) [Nitrososphaerota archaeon]MDG7046839.1 phosphoenolpyruvate carboxykinase (ATP) [Nitrososphaerota archaeon]
MAGIDELFHYIREHGRIIVNPGEPLIEREAARFSIANNMGIMAFNSKVKARSPDKTVEDINALTTQPDDIFESVRRAAGTGSYYLIDRAIGSSQSLRLKSELLISTKYPHLALMFMRNYFPAPEDREPDIRLVDIPEWPETAVYVDPLNYSTLILGSDYYGELKMSALRLGMHFARERLNMIGLHAGGKVYRWSEDGRMVERGALIFGLSGTGKSTLTVSKEEYDGVETIVRQDDIMILTPSGRAFGTEMNFYPKTDSIPSLPILASGLEHHDAILENVTIKGGKVDFSDLTVSSNGRAIAIKRSVKLSDDLFDIGSVNYLFFLTRRNDMPVVSKFSCPEQAAAYFLLGESVMTSAGTEDKSLVNRPVRTLGFDPFIIKPKWKNALILYQFLKINSSMSAYLVNTGSVGDSKITPRVTLDSLYAVVRGGSKWRHDEILRMDVLDGEGKFDIHRAFEKEQYEKRMAELRAERIKYIHENYPEMEFLSAYI